MSRTPPPVPYRPRQYLSDASAVLIPGSKLVEAKRLLREGKSLAEAAFAISETAYALDRELWRTLGHPLKEVR